MIGDARFDIAMFEGASPCFPKDSRAVRIVDIDGGAILFRQEGDVPHRCDIPIHTENSIGDDEGRFAGGPAAKQLLQVIHIPVVVDAKCGAAQAAAVDQTRVAEAVGEDESVFPDQRLNGADIRQIAGCEGECGFSVFEPGECRFEFFVGRKGAADETRGPGSCPVLTRRFDGRFYDGRVGGQAQVII